MSWLDELGKAGKKLADSASDAASAVASKAVSAEKATADEAKAVASAVASKAVSAEKATEDEAKAVASKVASAAVSAEKATEDEAKAAAEGAAEAAVEAACDPVVHAAVEAVAKGGVAQIVQQVTKNNKLAECITFLIDATVKKLVLDIEEEAVSKVKAALKAIKEGLSMARDNMKTWNVQITHAVKAGKLNEMEKVDGMQLTLANLFSATMNADIATFLDQMKPSMVKVNAVASVKKPDLDSIKKQTEAAQAVFVKAANEFLATLRKWDQKEDAIKSEAGVNFHVAAFSKAIDDVETIVIS